MTQPESNRPMAILNLMKNYHKFITWRRSCGDTIGVLSGWLLETRIQSSFTKVLAFVDRKI